jgi:hypothetical protein
LLIIVALLEDLNRSDVNQAKISEETMRKSLILALTAIGSGAAYGAGVTEVATGLNMSDPATWRWHVSSILAAQENASARRIEVGVLGAEAFNQRFERYTPSGLPQSRGALR